MADRLIRHIPTGNLFIYQAAFAERDDFEEVIDVESRVVEDKPVAAPAPKKTRAKAGLVEAPAVDNEALAADASHNLP